MSQTTFAGSSDSSTWARGEAWALYGFVQAYETSGNAAFLTTAEAIANYFVSHSPADGIPPWDFDAPGDSTGGHLGGSHRGGRAHHAEHRWRGARAPRYAKNILESLSSL